MTKMRETMQSQPEQLERLLADPGPPSRPPRSWPAAGCC